MNLDEFAIDPTVSENGKKVEFGAGSYIRVRSAQSDRSTKARERLWKPYSTWKDVPSDILDKVNADWISQGLLAEFVGFSVAGAAIVVDLANPDDQKRLAAIISQPKYKALRNRIISIAVEDANFQAEVDKAIEGKSGTSPAGSLPTGAAPNSSAALT